MAAAPGGAAGSRQPPERPAFPWLLRSLGFLCSILQLTGLMRELGRSGSAGAPTSLRTGKEIGQCGSGWCKPTEQVAGSQGSAQ